MLGLDPAGDLAGVAGLPASTRSRATSCADRRGGGVDIGAVVNRPSDMRSELCASSVSRPSARST